MAARLQLAVSAEDGAASVADTPTVSGKRRAAAQEIVPGHAARAITQPRRSWFAWGELGKIDGVGGTGKHKQRPDQQACKNGCLHPQSSPRFLGSRLNNDSMTKRPAFLCIAQASANCLKK